MLHSKQSQGIALTKGRENDQENEKRTTYQRERATQRHCRASLLEIEIEHSVEVQVRSSVNLRIVLHRTERFERELLIDITDVYDRTIRKNQREEHAFREARVCQGVRTQQLLEEAACACACIKPNSKKEHSALERHSWKFMKCTEKR